MRVCFVFVFVFVFVRVFYVQARAAFHFFSNVILPPGLRYALMVETTSSSQSSIFSRMYLHRGDLGTREKRPRGRGIK